MAAKPKSKLRKFASMRLPRWRTGRALRSPPVRSGTYGHVNSLASAFVDSKSGQVRTLSFSLGLALLFLFSLCMVPPKVSEGLRPSVELSQAAGCSRERGSDYPSQTSYVGYCS